jgi:ElaB/YqjD/DUF883 family membrane-anchored ribosome-binding protein
MSTNGSKRPEEILAEIDHTRHEMDRTLSAIEHRLTPGQLVDQGLDYLRHSGANEFVQNLSGTAKQNPMPVALVSIGLAWLMALGRQPAQSHSSMSSSGLRDKASGAMQGTSETLSSARERVAGSMDSMRHRASEITEGTRQQWQRARGGIDHLVNEQPLALGAIGLAIGAVLGAAAPRTRAEEQLMGEAARNLTEKAKEAGSQQLDKATQAAKQVAQTGMGKDPQQQARPQAPPQAAKQHPGPTAAGPDKKGAW